LGDLVPAKREFRELSRFCAAIHSTEKEGGMAKTVRILVGFAVVSAAALAVLAQASSPDSWDKFRAELVQGCIRAAGLVDPKIVVAPEGTASYGVALLTSATANGQTQSSVVCIMRKTPNGLTDVEVTPPASEWITIK